MLLLLFYDDLRCRVYLSGAKGLKCGRTNVKDEVVYAQGNVLDPCQGLKWDLMRTRGSFGYKKCSGSHERKCSFFFGWAAHPPGSLDDRVVDVRKGGEDERR